MYEILRSSRLNRFGLHLHNTSSKRHKTFQNVYGKMIHIKANFLEQTTCETSNNTERWIKRMISRDCDGCSQLKQCKIRFHQVIQGGLVHCPDGTAHLVDS